MILKGYPRISETFISNEILLLEARGIKVHIISMRQPRESFHHDSIKNIKAGVDYLPSTIKGNVLRLLKPNLKLAFKKPITYAKAMLTAARRYARTKKTATIKHLLQAGYVAEYVLPGKNITHLHAHFAHSPTSVAMFTSRLTGLPFSFTGHAKDIYTSDPRQLKEKIELARFVVTCTEYNRRHLSNLSKNPDKPIHRVYHGIDLSLFNGSFKNDDVNRDPYQILTVARLTAKKGLPTVYHALKLLKDWGVPFEHTLIGDGDDRDEILALIRELDLHPQAKWIGTQPHHVVIEHFHRSDLFVLGCEIVANGDRDGIPNVLVESMAMGVPVVTTNVSAIPELVVSGRTGLLVEPKDPEALAKAMDWMLEDQELRAKVISAAKEKVSREFDNKALIGRLAELFRENGLGAADRPHDG